MNEVIIMTGFIIWCIVGCLFFGIGVGCLFSKQATGFWANAERPKVTDVKKYNKAMSKLWFAFGTIMILLGIPLLEGQNSSLLVITIVGMFVEVIAFMVIYVLVIEKKYRKKN